MKPTAMLVAAQIMLPAVGLATWVCFAVAQACADPRSFSGFDGMHFEI